MIRVEINYAASSGKLFNINLFGLFKDVSTCYHLAPRRCVARSAALTTVNIALLLMPASDSAGMCLPNRCLAINYYSFQASCRNIYIYIYIYIWMYPSQVPERLDGFHSYSIHKEFKCRKSGRLIWNSKSKKRGPSNMSPSPKWRFSR
jgi:hypothetical protein